MSKNKSNRRRMKCFWCTEMVEVGLDAARVICSTCVAGGAKLPTPDLVDRSWEGDVKLADVLKTGFIPDNL